MTYKPTMEDYHVTGEELKELHERILYLDIWITKTFGKKFNLHSISKTESKLNQIRSDLEDKMFVDYPDKATTQIFYK